MDEKDKILDQINEKINSSPDISYKIGIIIGNLLPYVVLVLIAYLIYSYMKNKPNDDNNLLE